MARVAGFNVAPVKSTALHHPAEIDLRVSGVEGDHRFLVLEPDGRRLSEAGKAPLLGIRADFDPVSDRVILEFPGGRRVDGAASGGGEEFAVKLYDRRVSARAVDGPVAGAISEHLGRTMLLARVVEPEYAGGTHRVSLLSLPSVRDLGRRGGRDEMPDPRRFRMLVELDDCEPYEEDTWAGLRVRLGDAMVRVGDGIPRCLLTTMDPDTGAKDFPTLDVLATYRRQAGELPIGVYADVETPGRVRVGDPVEPI
jgi:MOSC domain-containing protein